MNFTESKKDSFKSNLSEQINLFMSRWHKKKKKTHTQHKQLQRQTGGRCL